MYTACLVCLATQFVRPFIYLFSLQDLQLTQVSTIRAELIHCWKLLVYTYIVIIIIYTQVPVNQQLHSYHHLSLRPRLGLGAMSQEC